MRSKYFAYAALCGLLASTAWHAMAQTPSASDTSTTAKSLLELPAAPTTSSMPSASAPPPSALVPAVQPPTPAIIPAPVPAAAGASRFIPPALKRRMAAGTVPNTEEASTLSETAKAEGRVAEKNPDILLEPVHLGTTSLMFSKSDMDVLLQALDIYDHSARAQKTTPTQNKDFLSSLLDTLKHDDTSKETILPLPNLYLGSIVYYSPGNWSVWLNGKKLLNRNNQASNEFYIDRISPSEIELLWTPPSLLDTVDTWRQLTEDGAHPLENVTVDAEKGRITLHMHTNQTFLPKSLAIREGLIKSAPIVPAHAQAAPDTPAAAPNDIMLKKGRVPMINPMAPN